jgi:hypothetical protein
MWGLSPILNAVPYLAPTYGQPGPNIYPAGWGRDSFCSNDLIGYPSGTSSLTHVFGNADLPWDKPLPAIPTAPNANSILTVSSATAWDGDFYAKANQRSSVTTTIKYLTAGKWYSVKFYTASTIPKLASQSQNVTYAEGIIVENFHPNGDKQSTDVLPLYDKKATWVPHTIDFKAQHSEFILRFSTVAKSNNEYVYGHIFVDQKSLKELTH